jgi:hypothetical protein
MLERERKVIFDSSRRDLRTLAANQDVVADHVLFPIVLVKTSALGVVDQIVFHRNAGAALVGIQSPAAVRVDVDIVKDVVADDCAFRRPQRINAAHVAQHAQAPAQNAARKPGEWRAILDLLPRRYSLRR